jgi:hypothetical protein
MKGTKLLSILALLISVASASAAGSDVRTAFQKFVTVQNAHDLASLKSILLDSPDFLWISAGTPIWGRDAALRQFAALYKGSWKLESDMAGFKAQQLGDGVAVVFVPVTITVGAPGKPKVKVKLLMSQIYARVGNDWKRLPCAE